MSEHHQPKSKHILTTTLAIVLSLLLLICLLIPIQHARMNTQEQYRELYYYKQQAQIYYRAIHIACANLDPLAVSLERALSKEPASSNGVLAAFSEIQNHAEVLKTQKKLSTLVGLYRYDLKQLPDPGRADLVNAVNDFFDAYIEYDHFLRKPPQDATSFCEDLKDVKKAVSQQDEKLQKILSELQF